jgi:hypothetical protein
MHRARPLRGKSLSRLNCAQTSSARSQRVATALAAGRTRTFWRFSAQTGTLPGARTTPLLGKLQHRELPRDVRGHSFSSTSAARGVKPFLLADVGEGITGMFMATNADTKELTSYSYCFRGRDCQMVN